MARTKRQSAAADEHNQEAEAQRQEAREDGANVVNLLTAGQRAKRRQEVILACAQRLDEVHEAAAGLRDIAKGIRLDCEAEGIDFKALSELVRWRRQDEDKRRAATVARREVARAFGWKDGDQIDLFDDEDKAEGLTPGLQREYLGPAEESPDMRAARESGFFTDADLAAVAARKAVRDEADAVKEIYGDEAEVEEISAEDA